MKWNNYVYLIGVQLLTLVGSTVLLSSILLLFNIDITYITFIISILIGFGISIYYLNLKFENKKQKYINIFVSNTIFIVLLIVALFISQRFYDISYDGQWYHQEAIIQLQEGWNPIYDQELDEDNNHTFFWINHYAKASWFYAASVYDLLGDIEFGKSINILLFFSSLFLAIELLIKLKLSNGWAIILATLFAFNPITVTQMFTYYVDGLLYSIFLILFIVLIKMYLENNYLNKLAVLFALVIIINIKFTALGYAIILCGIPILLVAYNEIFKEKRTNVKYVLKESLNFKRFSTIITGLFLGIIIVGWSSYVINFLDHKHPFYPLAGEGSVDIMTANKPTSYEGMNKVEELFFSIYSESYNTIEGELNLKFPFTITEDEMGIIWQSDLRVGGFGPLFGGIIILALLGLLICRKYLVTDFNKKMLIVFLVIIISIVINPELWWARYIPQLWMLPLMLMMMFVRKPNGVTQKIYMSVISIVIVLNIFFIFKENLKITELSTRDIDLQLEVLNKYLEEESLLVEFGSFRSNRIRFQDHNIPYIEVEQLECETTALVPVSFTEFCLADPVKYNEIFEKLKEK